MATTAKTKADVDNMTDEERLWDSLNHAYGQQQEASDASYNRAISQTDRQMLSRGMQRSSYGAQTLANLRNQQVKAQNDIESAKIADYENRLHQIQQDRQQQENWQASFDENQRQFNESQAFQKERAAASDAQWQKQYDANRADAAWQQAFSEKQYQANREDTAWQQAFQTQQYNDSRADTAWNQAFAQQQYNDSRSDVAWQQQFQQQQLQLQQEQWKEQFEYTKMSDSQKMAYNYIANAAANGADVSDALLQQAGISRADYNAMKKQASGGGYVAPKKPATGQPAGDSDASLLGDLNTSINPYYVAGMVTNATTLGAATSANPKNSNKDKIIKGNQTQMKQ